MQPLPGGAARARAARRGRSAGARRPRLLARLGALLGAALACPLRLQRGLRPDAHRLGAAGADASSTPSGRSRQLAYRYLGAWNVGALLLRKPAAVGRRTLGARPRPRRCYPVRNPYLLPRFRFVPRVSFHDATPALCRRAHPRAAQVQRHEHCVRAGSRRRPCDLPRAAAPARAAPTRGGGSPCATARPGKAFFVAAMTFDEGWRARLDGAPAPPLYPTAACQLGVELPAGEHQPRCSLPASRCWRSGAAVSLAGARSPCGRALPAAAAGAAGWHRIREPCSSIPLLGVYAAVLGLIVGSYLNVVIYRCRWGSPR